MKRKTMITEVFVDFEKVCEFKNYGKYFEFNFSDEDSVKVKMGKHSYSDVIIDFLPIILSKVGIIPTDNNTLIKNDLSQIMVFSPTSTN